MKTARLPEMPEQRIVRSLSPLSSLSDPVFVTVTCPVDKVTEVLGSHGAHHDLLSMCAYQKGIGFGSSIEVLLAFRLKERA